MPQFSSKAWFQFALTALVVLARTSAWAAVAEPPNPSPEQETPPTEAPIGLEAFEADAAALVDRGIQLRREHRDREALASFREAFDLAPTAKARAQIALAEQALGDWLPAEQDLITALSDSDPWIEANRKHLEASLEVIRRHLAWLVVSTNVDGAQLTLDGRAIGPVTDVKVRVVAGTVAVVVEAIGFQPVQSSVVVEPGAVVHQQLRLLPRIDVLAPSTAMPAWSAGASNTLAYPSENAAALARRQRAAAWVLVAGASLLLSEAIIAHVIGEHRASQYNDDARCVYGDLSRQQRCGHYKDQAVFARALAIVGYGTAAGAGIAAGMLFEKASRSNQLGRAPVPEFGVSWRGKW